MATKNCCKIIGIHGYLASNIMDEKPFFRAASYLKRCAKEFPDLEYLNFGSGYGVANDKKFKFNVIGNYYSKIMEELKEYFGRTIKLKIEPGRIIVATAGKLYASVTNIKNVKDKKQISVDAGFGEFVRPKLYNDYHEIEVLNNESEKEIYDIRGNTVLQDDFLARNVELRKLNENDIIAIKNSGAYGRVMASGFPGKRLPKEILI